MIEVACIEWFELTLESPAALEIQGINSPCEFFSNGRASYQMSSEVKKNLKKTTLIDMVFETMHQLKGLTMQDKTHRILLGMSVNQGPHK